MDLNKHLVGKTVEHIAQGKDMLIISFECGDMLTVNIDVNWMKDGPLESEDIQLELDVDLI